MKKRRSENREGELNITDGVANVVTTAILEKMQPDVCYAIPDLIDLGGRRAPTLHATTVGGSTGAATDSEFSQCGRDDCAS